MIRPPWPVKQIITMPFIETIWPIQGATIIVVNLLTIITITINRHLRKRSMYCVINLAVADMLFGIGALIWKRYSWKSVLIHFMGAGALFSLALVAVERMCATVWPVRHRNARPWAYALAISITWTSAAVTGLLLKATDISAAFLNLFPGFVAMAVGVGVICVSYLMIFIKVRQQQQEMAGQRVSGPDQRLAMTLFIVTVASFGTWTPLIVVYLLKASDAVHVPVYVRYLAVFLACANSLINPIIYVFRMKDFRKALLRLILACSRDRPRLAVPQAN